MWLQIVTHIQSQPGGFQPLIELDLFSDIHGVAAGADTAVEGTRNRICRVCATEVLLWGLKEWWIRERQKGFLEETVTNRKDCKDGSLCTRQKELGMYTFCYLAAHVPLTYLSNDLAHARECK